MGFRLCSEAWAALEQLLAQGISIESMLAAAWALVLHCYAGSEEEPLSLWIDRQGEEGRAAFALARIPKAGEMSAREWLIATAGFVAEATPRTTSDLRAAVSLRGRIGVSGLTAVVSQRAEIDAIGDNALVLSLGLEPEPELKVDCKSADVNSRMLEILGDCARHVLEQLLGSPEALLSRLSLVSGRVQEEYLDAAAQVDSDAPLEFVNERIEKWALDEPGRVAGSLDERSIGFGELNARANQLARYLIRLGAGPERIVAVHLKRSPELLIALLAILKAGAAYLPLDSSLPEKRMESVLDDSAAAVLITSSELGYKPASDGVRVVTMDGDETPWAEESDAAVRSGVQGNNLAYVIYTSGSTGKPKGVMIEHRNLSAFLAALDGWMGTTPGVWLALGSISFDISIVELLWTLSRGYQVVLHRGDGGMPVFSGADSVAAQIPRYGVTHILGTPTLIRILASDPEGVAALGSLRMCSLGGEPFPPALAAQLLEILPGRVFNAYGPTEITVCATYHRVEEARDLVPIGRPLGNSRLYIVDRWKRMLPPMAAGELLIGGPSVGRGYLGRPELTAQRFIANEFDASDRNRLYRTGDLVRMNVSGAVEFLDRLDSQVKIRGYRIELGEVEAALARHGEVEQAVALAIQDGKGVKTLAAYYTTKSGEAIASADLRQYLGETLPVYMTPAVLRHRSSLPLSTSGKVDRIALAQSAAADAPEARRGDEAAGENPDEHAGSIERNLCCWCGELLKTEVRAAEDFFEIGGESLAAARLMKRIADEYTVELRLSALVSVRTMRGLAGLIAEGKGGGQSSPVVPFRTEGSRPPLFFVAGLGGNVLNFEFVARQLADRPVYGVEAHGVNRDAKVLSTVESMAANYLAAIRQVQPRGPYHLAGYSFGGILVFEMAQQLRAAGEEIGFLGLLDTAEWRYSQAQLGSLGAWKKFRYKYGETLKQLVVGPQRRKTFRKRMKAARDQRRLASLQAAGEQAAASEVPVENRNYFALSQYVPGRYEGEIQLFRCSEGTLLSGKDPALGWGGLCAAVTAYSIEADHESLTSQRVAPELAKKLESALEAAARKGGKRKGYRDAA